MGGEKLYVSGWLDSIVLLNEVKVISHSSYGRMLSTLYLRGNGHFLFFIRRFLCIVVWLCCAKFRAKRSEQSKDIPYFVNQQTSDHFL